MDCGGHSVMYCTNYELMVLGYEMMWLTSIMPMVVRQWKGVYRWFSTLCADETCSTPGWWSWSTVSVCQAAAWVFCHSRKLRRMLERISFTYVAHIVVIISKIL